MRNESYYIKQKEIKYPAYRQANMSIIIVKLNTYLHFILLPDFYTQLIFHFSWPTEGYTAFVSSLPHALHPTPTSSWPRCTAPSHRGCLPCTWGKPREKQRTSQALAANGAVCVKVTPAPSHHGHFPSPSAQFSQTAPARRSLVPWHRVCCSYVRQPGTLPGWKCHPSGASSYGFWFRLWP